MHNTVGITLCVRHVATITLNSMHLIFKTVYSKAQPLILAVLTPTEVQLLYILHSDTIIPIHISYLIGCILVTFSETEMRNVKKLETES